MHARQDLLDGSGQRQIYRVHVVRGEPGRHTAQTRLLDNFTQTNDGQSGKHVSRTTEEAIDSRDVDLEETRGAVGTGGRTNDGEGRASGFETDGGDDNVRDAVFLVETNYCFAKRGE